MIPQNPHNSQNLTVATKTRPTGGKIVKTMNPQEAFLDLLIAAMLDAAGERKLTQLQSTIEVKGKLKLVRIIVIPEEMDFKWAKDQPYGTDPKKQ